jgi:hypothetical protein
VKYDRLVNYTNNYFIEFQNNNGKDSGINITTANYHILTDGKIYYMIETSNIILIIEGLRKTNKLKIAISKEGSQGYLIKKELIISLSRII